LQGWFGYFKHGGRSTFRSLDQWVRGRLRSLLRRRSGRRGIATGLDHQRWPNAFFTEQGYLSLEAAHVRACQPPSG
jgi:RNA-directed DNA polymerase